MIITKDMVFADESKSNHIAQAISCKTCPIDKACLVVFTGMGGAIERCEYFNDLGNEETAECKYGEISVPIG